ncbi:DUF4179 domain-containing protein [Neobacillus sp. WH10]|uniref:DUF4179 domain-containing protein n=1 Tax=Neobacillus sp. WH10 TaxID=3047873 RepID=UPI0024C1CD9B|nr:DUF4179 domain-containing protein [Neobacillus sp. WH10]WHY78495.1 DUF4179 domain-containing protein [Neobacillus sp. WH10]
MKDIYELLNDLNIDENEFEEMEVNELEKAHIKRSLKKEINKKKKRNSWKKSVTAASIIVGLSVTTFVAYPAYAGNIPVIEDIFRFFDNGKPGFYNNKKENSQNKETGLYYDYKKFSSELNITKESNGVKITINDAVFDGKTLTLTYTIESEQDLGNADITMPRITGMKAYGGTGKTSKIDTNKYVGILTVSNIEDKKLDVAHINWDIDHIQNPDNQTVIKGDWKFAFSLNATDSKIQLTDGIAEKNGVKVSIGKISFNPMSFTVYYDQEVTEMVKNKWDGVDVELEIKDDLGNIYSGEDNGGMRKDSSYHVSGSKTFEKLDPNATKLIITPHITLRDYNSDNFASVEITNDGKKEISLPEKPGKGKEEFVLEDIIIKIQK